MVEFGDGDGGDDEGCLISVASGGDDYDGGGT